MPLSSCLLLNPLENSPPKILWNALHKSHTNERHYTLQRVRFKDDLQFFPSAVRNGNLPRAKLRNHLQYSKDIKGFKLCIGFIISVRTTKKCFYQMWHFHNRMKGLWVISIKESMPAFHDMQQSMHKVHVEMLSGRLYLSLIQRWHKHCFCLRIHKISHVLGQTTLLLPR